MIFFIKNYLFSILKVYFYTWLPFGVPATDVVTVTFLGKCGLKLLSLLKIPILLWVTVTFLGKCGLKRYSPCFFSEIYVTVTFLGKCGLKRLAD